MEDRFSSAYVYPAVSALLKPQYILPSLIFPEIAAPINALINFTGSFFADKPLTPTSKQKIDNYMPVTPADMEGVDYYIHGADILNYNQDGILLFVNYLFEDLIDWGKKSCRCVPWCMEVFFMWQRPGKDVGKL